jgi:two-component system, chemotaxis family, protein-glutamate methylesterase/glutaminase
MSIRILVVDDSVVIRKLLTTTLSEVPGLEVVATAALGKIALAKIAQCHPDVVILDVEMPEMDGIETLKQIRKIAPRLPVIMFSTRTERGAAATIEALTSGASDYVAKPSNVGNVLLAMQRVREEMVPKIQALTAGTRSAATRPPSAKPTIPPPVTGSRGIPVLTPVSPMAPLTQSQTIAWPPVLAPRPATLPIATSGLIPHAPPAGFGTSALPASAPATTPIPQQTTRMPALAPRARGNTSSSLVTDGPIRLHRPSGPRPPVEIIAIGASTGGPNALAMLLTQLPAELPVPIVIVQHMLATFTRHFAERLATQCRIQIVEANAGDVLVPGCAYIARGDHHLLVERRAGRASLVLNQGEVENFCRPAVDVLFRSVALIYGAGALAVILTGMGHDGLLGCGAIRDAGGEVIVQDEASSVVWGMPGFVARAGLASQVMPLELLGGEIRRRVALGPRGAESRP